MGAAARAAAPATEGRRMPCGRIGTTELLLLGLLVVLLFGAGRLPEIGRGLGLGIKRFKKSLRDEDEDPKRVEREERKDDE
jgi:sec-independent protein translocase protein TatA